MKRWVLGVLLLLIIASAHAYDDKDRMAALATRMLNLTSGDYSMNCGPSREVLPTVPAVPKGDYYCVMDNAGAISFGTFQRAGSNSSAAFLQVLNDSAFSNQITSINLNACGGKGLGKFEICPNAIISQYTTLYLYVYTDGTDGTQYFVASENSLTQLEGDYGIIDKVLDFFKRLFA